VNFKHEKGSWVLTSGSGKITFGPVEVQKLKSGVIFTGISPEAVAEAVAQDLAQQQGRLTPERHSQPSG
jgi:hypothetical protein